MPNDPKPATCPREGCTNAASSSKDGWCKQCRAGYQRSYRLTLEAKAEGVGFGRGVEAMRETMAREFARLGLIQVKCLDVAEAIRKAPRPAFQPPVTNQPPKGS